MYDALKAFFAEADLRVWDVFDARLPAGSDPIGFVESPSIDEARRLAVEKFPSVPVEQIELADDFSDVW